MVLKGRNTRTVVALIFRVGFGFGLRDGIFILVSRIWRILTWLLWLSCFRYFFDCFLLDYWWFWFTLVIGRTFFAQKPIFSKCRNETTNITYCTEQKGHCIARKCWYFLISTAFSFVAFALTWCFDGLYGFSDYIYVVRNQWFWHWRFFRIYSSNDTDQIPILCIAFHPITSEMQPFLLGTVSLTFKPPPINLHHVSSLDVAEKKKTPMANGNDTITTNNQFRTLSLALIEEPIADNSQKSPRNSNQHELTLHRPVDSQPINPLPPKFPLKPW